MKEPNLDAMGWNAPRHSRDDSGNEPEKDPWGRDNPPRNDSDPLAAVLGFLKKVFGQGRGRGSGKKRSPGSFVGAVAGLVIAGIVVSGFYTVREAERGVVLRFGKIYDVSDPGLRWKIPVVDSVNVVDIEQVRALQSSGTMLTQDENVVIVEMDVQYRISDPIKYLYSTTDPDHTLLEATDSALRYVIGHTLMDDILTSGREMVRQNTRELLTSIIEPYNTGLSIVDVNFLPARAPDQVKAAFDDAISAQEDEQRYKREAEAYANEVLPKADGKVQRIRQEAEAYRSQVVLNAQGEVARFEKVLPEYEKAPEITRQRIYFETMEQVMGKSRKVILDTPEGTSPVIYLPLPKDLEQGEESGGDDASVSELREEALKKAAESAQRSSTQSQDTEQKAQRRGYPPLNGTGYGQRN
ncbi:MAG: FtsH protease activity modulator HflK [Succinivibrio sp.]|jgi:membrane protease subunit HflK|nr:FtsH protease activity modulator HflK [Succinivibrio sp.]